MTALALWLGCMLAALGFSLWCLRRAIKAVTEEDLPDDETAI